MANAALNWLGAIDAVTGFCRNSRPRISMTAKRVDGDASAQTSALTSPYSFLRCPSDMSRIGSYMNEFR